VKIRKQSNDLYNFYIHKKADHVIESSQMTCIILRSQKGYVFLNKALIYKGIVIDKALIYEGQLQPS
jgi:hypothetical protein